MDAALAGRLLLAGQKSLSRVLADEAESPLDTALADLDARGRAVCCRWLAEAQDMLQYGVTPARVLEALRRASEGRTVLSVSHRIYENLGGRTVEIKML